MGLALPLETMSIEEKIETMELIWNELCYKAKSVESPQWHKEILSKREEDVQNGNEEFIDWETAKKDIKNKINWK